MNNNAMATGGIRGSYFIKRSLAFVCVLVILVISPTAIADIESDWRHCANTVLPEYKRTGQVGNRPIDQYCYGLAYAFGYFEGGVQHQLAASWYQRAASGNHAGAMVALGYSYEKAYGVNKDPQLAASWYQKAADAGNADGMYNLARLFDAGTGVEKNAQTAQRWFKAAADAGNQQAQQRLSSSASTQNTTASASADNSDDFIESYLLGLEALRSGEYQAAESLFDTALSQTGDNATLILARGVARVFNGRYTESEADFNRYGLLGGTGREAKLWTYVSETMSGRVSQAHSIPVPRSLQGEQAATPDCTVAAAVSVPGHVIQGGTDYTTAYASFLIYEMAASYADQRCGKSGVSAIEVSKHRKRAASWFANRHMSEPGLAEKQLDRAWKLLEEKRYQEAMEYADFAQRSLKDNSEVAALFALCWLELGRPQSTRKQFTIALTMNPDVADSYAWRALSAARMGDADQAHHDIEVARNLDPESVAIAEGEVDEALARLSPTLPAMRWWRDLAAAARTSGVKALLPYARRLQRSAAAERIRYDEWYQARLRQLESAVDAEPDNPDAHVAIGRFLADEAYPRGESVEPRRGRINYRWQSSEASELQHAIKHYDEALAIDSRHVGAMLNKAAVLSRLERTDEAEKLADDAIAIAPNDPKALSLYAFYKGRRANWMNAEAHRLRQDTCSSSTHTEHRYDGVWDVTTTTCYPPTAADLNRANQLDAQAEQLRSHSIKAMQRAIAATRGTYDGLLLEAEAALWSGRANDAESSLKKAIEAQPKRVEAYEHLERLYDQLGMTDKQIEQQILVNRFYQTTAAPLLKRVWDHMATTRWKAATVDLERAAELDPADARVPAYLGAVREAQGDYAGAAAAWRMALAMEQTRIELDEPADVTARIPRDARDFGLIMALRARLGQLVTNTGIGGDDQLSLAEGTIADVSRFPPGWESDELFNAMLPDIRDPGTQPPAPVNAATLVASAWRDAALVLKASGRREEAIAALRAAASLGPAVGIPRIASASGDSNFAGEAGEAAGDAIVYLAQELMQMGDYEGAYEEMQKIGYYKLSDEGRRLANDLNKALSKVMN